MSRFDRNFVDQVLARTSIIEVVGRKVVWDKRKSQPARGDMWACCPFHNEKSPSFHAQEAKGLYHCFGCGASGSAIDFVMNTQNMGYSETISQLALAAGMEVPKQTQQSKEKADKSARALEALAIARQLFEDALYQDEGKSARDYLLRRGIAKEDWKNFGLGYSSNQKNWLRDKLNNRGFDTQTLIDAGLIRVAEEGSAPYEIYRNRLMFAIEDTAGKTISFGARTLDKDGMPKYLNGPESLVFSKSFTLYRYGQAREKANAKPQTNASVANIPIIIAEGYMDVIALEIAGFPAVAPMGTALTADQLNLAWRACPRPILCFDGDDAGIRAGKRALERALPLVSPLRSVGFAIMPKGQDPDDILRANGRTRMLEIISEAQDLARFLFNSEIDEAPIEGAEARAALKSRLRQKTNEIKDEDLKNEIRIDIKSMFDAHFGRTNIPQIVPFSPNASPRFARGKPSRETTAIATEELKLMYKDASGAPQTSKSKPKNPPRILIDIVCAPIFAPILLESGAEALARLELGHEGLESLRDGLLDYANTGATIDFIGLDAHLKKQGRLSARHVLALARKTPVNAYVAKGESAQNALGAWLVAIEKIEVARALRMDAKEAIEQIGTDEAEAFRKLALLSNQRHNISKDDAN